MEMIDSLHPLFRPHAPVLLDIIEYAVQARPEPEELLAAIDDDPEWQASWRWALRGLQDSRVTGLGGSAFSVPFLHPDVCANLVKEAVRLGEERGFMPNPDEESPYQIPEILIREADPELFAHLAELIKYLNIWFMLVYQTVPAHISSIQFAKYEPNGTAHGNWHHDKTSDFTAVVSLAPDMFEGGGTDIRLSPVDYVSVQPLPPGHALIMNGKQVLHRGRAVISGTRHILTYWLEAQRYATGPADRAPTDNHTDDQ